uniref:DUF4129 domain-containing protein n=1 Tax=Macrostomum lignano TaxID=282301 RepID=A0A1I8IBW6_9PLAT
ENDQGVAVEVAQSLFSTSNKHLGIVAAIFGVLFILLFIWERVYWQPRNPEYKFEEMNWNYERQKTEAEFGRQLDFKNFYRHSRRLSKTSRQQKRNQDLTEPDPAQNKDLTATTDRVAEL